MQFKIRFDYRHWWIGFCWVTVHNMVMQEIPMQMFERSQTMIQVNIVPCLTMIFVLNPTYTPIDLSQIKWGDGAHA